MHVCLEHEADHPPRVAFCCLGFSLADSGNWEEAGADDERHRSHGDNCLVVAFGAIYWGWAADEDVLPGMTRNSFAAWTPCVGLGNWVREGGS